MRILLIEDTAAYHDEFTQLLADSGVGFSTLERAATAREGLRLISCGAHDIYFVDYRLPGTDGLQLVRAARAAGVAKPIIVLTGFDSAEVDTAAEQSGANDFLSKGEFSPKALNRAIRYAMRNAADIEAARLAESRFRMAQDAANIGTWDWDLPTNTFVWSPRQYLIWGVNPQAGPVGYDTWSLRIHPDDRDGVQAAVTRTIAGVAPFDTLFRINRRDPAAPHAPAAMRWISAKGELVRDANGAPTRLVGLCLDVTEQHETMAALHVRHDSAVARQQQSEARFQTYFESATDCLFHVRPCADGTFRYEAVNPAGLAHAGHTMEQMRDRTPEDVLGPEVGSAIAAGLRRVCETGQPYAYEPTFSMNQGTIVYDAIYLPLRDDTGAIVGVLGTARDITERRRLQASLQQTQKMEALGQLAGGIAHDFNNLLTGMLGCLEVLGKRHVASEAGRRLVREGRRTVERGTALTGRLLAFSRRQPLATEAVDLNASLDDMSEMLARTLTDGVRVGQRFAADLWLAKVDRNQIEVAVLNLAINARDAMPLGGTITLETRNERLSEAQNDGLAPGDYVALVISDTGTGMPPDVLAHVLEPFYTTKDMGKGTGLGLSMVYGVVRQLGGGLRIASEVGKGTSVTMLLPRAQPQASVSEPAASRQPPMSASILLVDDDPSTQATVAAYAAELGHSLALAASANEALKLLATTRPVDIMVADATMPGMGAADLVAHARVHRPGLPVVLISGADTAYEPADLASTCILAKPFRADAFVSALAALLPARPQYGKVVELRRGG